jgi:hypothetical protein
MIKNNHLRFFIFTVLLSVFSITGCKKLVTVDAPLTSINSQNVFENDETAISVLNGLYTRFSTDAEALNLDFSGGTDGISLYTGLSADEIAINSQNSAGDHALAFYQNQLTSTPSDIRDFWTKLYSQIYITNAAIEGLNGSHALTPLVKAHLLGEAKFMRAFYYFYLVNLYGDVPLVISTDYKKNALLARAPKDIVYQQMVQDITDAINLLPFVFVDKTVVAPTSLRSRPNQWAAKSLLSRIYLFQGKYELAEVQATDVINNTSLFQLNSLNDVFLANSTEAIWQIQPVGNENNSNTSDGKLFILDGDGPTAQHPFYLSSQLIAAFETGDQRKVNWTKSVTVGTSIFNYAYKYKIGDVNSATFEYYMIFRLAEQYLIRAESRAHLNNLSGAKDDLNLIRTRAGLTNIVTTDMSLLLAAIAKERQVELFTEWGHRWFDLKRTKKINDVMGIVTPLKGGTAWMPTDALYPILLHELQSGISLTQNPGY